MKTLLVNLKHAARNGQYVHIGGGIFTPADITKAVNEIDAAIALLQTNLDAWDDEEDSVREEHSELIKKTRTLLEGLK